jgi:hypothetical protein
MVTRDRSDLQRAGVLIVKHAELRSRGKPPPTRELKRLVAAKQCILKLDAFA